MKALRPAEWRELPVPRLTMALHRLAFALSDRNPYKGKVRADHKIGWHYDANVAQSLIFQGKILPSNIKVNPKSNTIMQWGFKIENNTISQVEGSMADLIWVATMSLAQAAKPVLFFVEPGDNGYKLLDGSHRLMRADLDGKAEVDAYLVSEQDSSLFLRQD